MFPLKLLLAKTNLVPKKRYSKKNLVGVFGSGNAKVILTLLIKLVAFYIRLAIIHVQEVSFQEFISRLFGGDESLSLQNNLQNLLQVFFGILRNRKCSGKDDSYKKYRL